MPVETFWTPADFAVLRGPCFSEDLGFALMCHCRKTGSGLQRDFAERILRIGTNSRMTTIELSTHPTVFCPDRLSGSARFPSTLNRLPAFDACLAFRPSEQT